MALLPLQAMCDVLISLLAGLRVDAVANGVEAIKTLEIIPYDLGACRTNTTIATTVVQMVVV